MTPLVLPLFLHRRPGELAIRNLSFGRYPPSVSAIFLSYDAIVEIHSALSRLGYVIKLQHRRLSTAVDVKAENTLLDPERTTTIITWTRKRSPSVQLSLPAVRFPIHRLPARLAL